MSMTEWAENEVKIACKRENPDWDGESFDYGCSCYQSALKAYKSVLSDDHSGFSYGITKSILKRLLDEKPLTPIEDTEDVWGMSYKDEDGSETFQCKRMSSLFKNIDKDGNVSYSSNHRVYCQELDNHDDTFSNGFAERFVDKLFPITMPYYPESKPYKVVVKSFLAKGFENDHSNYNTIAFLWIETPTGKKIDLNYYYADKGNTMVEITHSEYDERLKNEIKKENK